MRRSAFSAHYRGRGGLSRQLPRIMPGGRALHGQKVPLRRTIRHNSVRGIMTELVADRPVKIDRLEEGRRRGHLDGVGARDIEGAVAADADIGAGRADQRLGLRQDQVVGQRFRRRRDRGRDILALVGIKDREALEERDRVGFVAGFGGARALAVGNK